MHPKMISCVPPCQTDQLILVRPQEETSKVERGSVEEEIPLLATSALSTAPPSTEQDNKHSVLIEGLSSQGLIIGGITTIKDDKSKSLIEKAVELGSAGVDMVKSAVGSVVDTAKAGFDAGKPVTGVIGKR